MELIDKAAVVAEIEKQGTIQPQLSWFTDKLIQIINDSLEVKELDLEDEYMVDREIAREKSILDETKVEYFATGNPTIAAYSEDNLRNQFDAGADWMKEQMIRVFAKTLEVKEVNLEKIIEQTYHDRSVTDTSDMDHVSYENIARHFFELGIKVAQKRE